MTQTVDREAELLFSMVMKLGFNDFSSQRTKSAILAECQTSRKLRDLATQYLAGDSSRATVNFYRLHAAIVKVFFTDPISGKLVINGKLVF